MKYLVASFGGKLRDSFLQISCKISAMFSSEGAATLTDKHLLLIAGIIYQIFVSFIDKMMKLYFCS